jgi:transketolase C-terminal domain/subunit
LAGTVKAIFTVEEHAAAGGLGSVVAEALAAQPRKVLFKSIAVRENVKFIGSQNYLRVKLGLDPEGIATAITKAIRKQ